MTVSVYIFIPIMPVWLMENEHFTPIEAGRSMGVFGLGLYSFGAICSWLVQRFGVPVVDGGHGSLCCFAVVYRPATVSVR